MSVLKFALVALMCQVAFGQYLGFPGLPDPSYQAPSQTEDQKASLEALKGLGNAIKGALKQKIDDGVKKFADEIKEAKAKVEAKKGKEDAAPAPLMPITKYKPGICAGAPWCFPTFVNPLFTSPVLSCSPGFSLARDTDDRVVCVKKSKVCPSGLTAATGGKCCAPCPAGCTPNGNICVGTPRTTCTPSATGCPSDTVGKKVCPQDTGYAGYYGVWSKKSKDPKPVDPYTKPDVQPCLWDCCRTTTPTYPLTCADPIIAVETVSPLAACPTGTTYVDGRCLVRPGGMSSCPSTGKPCTCGKGKKAVEFCATAKTIYGIDSCEVACLKPEVPRYACPVDGY